MWKSGVTALLAAAALSPALAEADAFEQGMNTMWEVLWHQSGTPTRLVRWEQDIQVRVFGVNAAAHRQQTLKALRAVAAETGVKVIDVSSLPLSRRSACGLPYSSINCSITRMTRRLGIECATSIPSTSRLPSSMTLKVRKVREL